MTATKVAPPLLGSHDCHATPNCSTLSGLRRTLRWLLVLRRSGCNARTGPRICMERVRCRTWAQSGPNSRDWPSRNACSPIGATATFTLDWGCTHRSPPFWVKGSRVQISPARHRARFDGQPRWRRCSSAPVSAIHISAVCRTQPLRKGASSRSHSSGPRGLGRREPPHPRVAPDGDSHRSHPRSRVLRARNQSLCPRLKAGGDWLPSKRL